MEPTAPPLHESQEDAVPLPIGQNEAESDILESLSKGLERIQALHDPPTDSQLSCRFRRTQRPVERHTRDQKRSDHGVVEWYVLPEKRRVGAFNLERRRGKECCLMSAPRVGTTTGELAREELLYSSGFSG